MNYYAAEPGRQRRAVAACNMGLHAPLSGSHDTVHHGCRVQSECAAVACGVCNIDQVAILSTIPVIIINVSPQTEQTVG